MPALFEAYVTNLWKYHEDELVIESFVFSRPLCKKVLYN